MINVEVPLCQIISFQNKIVFPGLAPMREKVVDVRVTETESKCVRSVVVEVVVVQKVIIR